MRRRAGLLLAAAVLLSACAGTAPQPDGSVSYRYSTFDFSGDAWRAQRQLCARDGRKPRHVDTQCGFWVCTSRLACE